MLKIYITTKNDYVENFSFDILDGGVLVEISEKQFKDFDTNYKSYKLVKGKIVKDTKFHNAITTKNKQNEIRELREIECFTIINRGKLWYEKLTPKQEQELSKWYQDWLDAPGTMEVPKRLRWLNETNN